MASPESYWNLLNSMGATTALAEQIEQYCRDSARHPEALLLLAELRRRQGDMAQAGEIFSQIGVDETALASCSKSEASFLAKYFHGYGLLRRELGDFTGAASAFLSALEVCPEFSQSLFALQFTRLECSELSMFIDRLERIASSSSHNSLLASQLYADWSYSLGNTENSLIRSFCAAKSSVAFSRCAADLDHLAVPSCPEALIVGAPKCGTTSMAAWLSAHPQIYMHPRKELHFFDGRWDRGADWYKCQFPVFMRGNASVVRMEATPNYLQIPEVPARVAQLMPSAKIIVILRHPLERALSWCHHIVRQDGASGSPEEIIGRELVELAAMAPEGLRQLGWHATNCLAGSLYHLQLERWYSHFPLSQICVLQMEQLVGHPDAVWQEILQFLQVDSLIPLHSMLPKLNSAPFAYAQLRQDILERATDILGDAFSAWEEAGR